MNFFLVRLKILRRDIFSIWQLTKSIKFKLSNWYGTKHINHSFKKENILLVWEINNWLITVEDLLKEVQDILFFLITQFMYFKPMYFSMYLKKSYFVTYFFLIWTKLKMNKIEISDIFSTANFYFCQCPSKII